jgi:hypothetical protein
MEAQSHRLLGEILVDLGFLNIPQVNEARRKQMDNPNVLLGEYLVELGYVTPKQLLEALNLQAASSLGFLSGPSRAGLPAPYLELTQLTSHPLFRAFADQLDQACYIIAWGSTREEDRLLYVNPALASLSGMEAKDFLDKSAEPVVRFAARFFDNPRAFLERIYEFLTHRPEPFVTELELSRPRRMKFEIRNVPLKGCTGQVLGAAGFLKTI